jgi:nicotinamide-nucleotide amidase
MDLELVTIGTELLLGFTLDANAAALGRALAAIGVRVTRRTTVPDDGAAIAAAVAEALARTKFVITTGGLGPTRDDVTKRAVAALFDAPLILDQAYLEQLRQRFERLGRGPMPESNRTQAEVPKGAIVLPNRFGTAPGLWLEGALGTVILLPGPPKEMNGLLEQEVLPRLRERLSAGGQSARATLSRTLRTTGIAESALADRIGDLEEALRPATLAYLPSLEGVDLRLTVWDRDPEEGARVLEQAAERLREVLGAHYYGDDGCDLAAVVLEALERRGLRLAVAESCTGGLLGQRITSVPGASRTFVGGVIAYANQAKAALLGVPESLIAEHGAVSEPVVRAMAVGAAERLGASVALAVTGIAGPTGGTAEKPVGTVWLATYLEGSIEAVRRQFPGDRDEVRRRSAQAALDALRRRLSA